MSEFLKKLSKVIKNRRKRNIVIKNAKKHELNCIRNICFNVCQGRFKFSNKEFKQLYKHRNDIRCLADKKKLKKLVNLRRKLLLKGGFMPALLPVILSLISSVGSKLIERAIPI